MSGLALLGLALVALIQAGCQSSGCSNCSLTGIGNKLSNGVQSVGAKVFKHFDHKGVGCDSCGGGVGGYQEGVVIDSGMPIAPGGMIMQGPGVSSPGASMESPTQLEPIESSPKPTGAATPNPASTRGTTGTNRTAAYDSPSTRSSVASKSGTDISRAGLAPANSRPRPLVKPTDSGSLIDNIPPFDLPTDVTRKATSASSSAPSASPAPVPVPAPAAGLAPTNPVAPPTAENHSAEEGAVLALAPIVVASSNQVPGIKRSGSVAPSIGGGSVPSLEGLDWLKEKGYRTFIDLRQSQEIEPNFADAVNDRGMVYISLPIMVSRLDASRLARFSDLISQAENRPLYFCDADGTRAGLLWYLYLRTVKKNDVQYATQEAEEIGLTAEQVKVAEAYLAAHPPKGKPVAVAPIPGSVPTPPSTTVSAPFQPGQTPSQVAIAIDSAALPPLELKPAALPTDSGLPAPAPEAPPVPSDSPPIPMLPGEEKPQASRKRARFLDDPASWKPIAALVLSGLGIPLAYWSRSAITRVRTVKRASLPAAAPRPLGALPASSDA